MRLGSQRGLSLFELVIALGITMVVVFLAGSSMLNMTQVERRVGASEAVDELRMIVRTNVDCRATALSRPNPCAAGTALAVYRRGDNQPYIIKPTDTTYSRIGAFNLKATCSDAWNGALMIQFSKTITGWKDLFDIPLVCRE